MDNSGHITMNNERTIRGWAFFDWANSSYALTIAVALFPAYYAGVTDDIVHVFGMDMPNTTLYAYAISGAYLIIAILSPILSGIADYGGKRMFFMRFFTILGSISCISLFWFQDMSQLTIGTIGFMLATIGFAGGLVFYNSFLPLIVSEDRYDAVSAKGYSYGYIGSVILLLLNLVVVMSPETFGIDPEGTLQYRIAFIMVGLWWIGFAIIPFSRLPKDAKNKPQDQLLSKGFGELKKVWRAIKKEKNIKSFLFSFFCYSAGVQTVLFLAATFAEKELEFQTAELIGVVLILQVVAIGGAHLFAKLSDIKGNIFSLIVMLMIWTVICLMAYFVTQSWQFYSIAAGVGLVMGGIQSLSRSTYTKLLPDNTEDTTSYFSFYDILEKFAIVLGTFSFGFIEQLTGGMRNSMIALTFFFIIGIFLLLKVKIAPQNSQIA
ncbi:MAG: MFS transporter [Bacteroidetes bacterium]|jgi:UMF1 family MFS transporter|nr:MFS transporter [Bacteroidota bacterium]